uniref:Endonuclease n=1 Tax=Sinocyclocheilus anshuiensis TaxID=1608454 RepID=A0A671MJ97_9TELE
MMLLLCVLMLSLLSGGSARVVGNFEIECGQYFANGKSPTTFSEPQYRQICQTLSNVPYFLMFSIDSQLQLDDNNGPPDMKFEKDVKNQGLGVHQALSDDYKNSGFDRGHLAPVYQAESQSCADATFTLTNAAPQNLSFNRGQWRKLEENIAIFLNSECKLYTVYTVTGVVPGASQIKNRVNVPSHFLTAYCCLDNNKKCQFSKGFIGENKNITPKEKNELI